MADSSPPVRKVSEWVTSLAIIGIIALAAFDLTQGEQVPNIVYGILGGVALSANPEFFKELLPGFFRGQNDK